MSGLTVSVLFAGGALFLAATQASVRTAAWASGTLLVLYLILGPGSWTGMLLLLSITVLLALLSHANFRKSVISAPLLEWFSKVLPVISATEQEGIDAGTVWWEGELFSGRPDWEKLLASGRPGLTEDERALIDGPLEQLCRMVDNWKINHECADIPAEVVAFINTHRFLGMIIPRQYGGLELSAVAQSEVLTKLFGVSSVVANYVGVPNSLGPAELLLKYGTEEQKDYYLPRLANGAELPCFALTSTVAGSDATAIIDTGVVCKGIWQGREITGMQLNFDKRYITLAPVATIVGLAFRLLDPEHLLGDVDDYGITCALIPAATPGVETGSRHFPIGDPFLNGPVRGKDIFVPLDYIIGGSEMAGKGWRMLVDCLSVGRAISLPSISNCLAKRSLAGSSAYACIRRQFNYPLAKFEGIQKPLARITGLTYIINAARLHTAQAVDAGAKPAVPSSILKYHCTEMARQVGLDAMDIHGGKAIMKGPANYLAPAYEAIPVAITVEGANILTRTLMIFGQGATRCHPFVLKEMEIARQEVSAQTIAEFDQVLFSHVGYTLRNAACAFMHALTGSMFAGVMIESPVKRYYQHINRLSAAFALVSDAAMLVLQGNLKRREMLSGRLGDLLSMLYLASMVLKDYEDEGCPAETFPVVEWSCRYLLHNYQVAMHEILQNFPSRSIALVLRLLVFPLGQRFDKPDDSLDQQLAELVTRDSATRRYLVQGIYLSPAANNPLGVLHEIFLQMTVISPLESKLRHAVNHGKLDKHLHDSALVDAANKAGIISASEAEQLLEYQQRVKDIIKVNEFPYNAFARVLESAVVEVTVKKRTPGKKTAGKIISGGKPGAAKKKVKPAAG
jgi:acyl-CoA dehydrogenase